LIERSFQGLSGAIETIEIIKELIEIWLNEVYDIRFRVLTIKRELPSLFK